MRDFIADIRAMHAKFQFQGPDHFEPMENSLLQMRLNFLLEELSELVEACGSRWHVRENALNVSLGFNLEIVDDRYRDCHPEKILDALVDLMVVLLGTAHLMGLSGVFEEAWGRVMTANMAKERGQGKRGHGMDLVKPEGWRAPDLGDLIWEEGEE